MALEAGTRLGPYEIVAPLGAGGMGEVYRGRDTRLDRIVAVKVLAAHLSANPDLKARFEREARAISALQNSSICTLYDVGHENGTDFLVMEYLEGEPLSRRIERGALPTSELLKIAVSIADALDKAHRAGIVHRDLKPANVMLTKSGAKLLDFGLATPAGAIGAAAGSSPSASVFAAALTRTSPATPLTSVGSIVGTVQYMSPEQIEGKEVDARSDIFSFGLMLYEMATGRRAFEGKTQASIIASILALEPAPLSSVQPTSPAALDRVVQSCIAKDPDERIQSAHDLRLQLEMVRDASSASSAVVAAMPRVRKNSLLPWAAAALLLIPAALWIAARFKQEAPRQMSAFELDLGHAEIVNQTAGSRIAVSEDGRNVVALLETSEGARGLYLRNFSSTKWTLLPGSTAAARPFFSPDGKWVGFSDDGKLKKMPLAGGLPVKVCDLPAIQFTNASWGDEGTILFTTDGGLWSVSADGGQPQRLSKAGEIRWARFLPGGKAALLSIHEANEFRIEVITLADRRRERIIEGGSWPAYLSSGFLVYAQNNAGADKGGFTGALLAVRFDLKSLKASGPHVPIMDGVNVGSGGAGYYDVSPNGTIVFAEDTSSTDQRMALQWATQDGKASPIAEVPPHHFHLPVVSHDGQRIAVAVRDAGSDIYTYDIKRKLFQRLTFDGASENPVWSPDDKKIIYGSYNDNGMVDNLWWKNADGSGEAERLTKSPYLQVPHSWSPDGSTVSITEEHPSTGSDIYLFHVSDRAATPFLSTKHREGSAFFSPNGKWMAYQSNESGPYHIYVVPYPAAPGKWQISTEPSGGERWSPDGSKIYFVGNGKTLVSVDVSANGNSFTASPPRPAFGNVNVNHGEISNYSLGRDGRLLFGVTDQVSSTALQVIENFDIEVRKRVESAAK